MTREELLLRISARVQAMRTLQRKRDTGSRLSSREADKLTDLQYEVDKLMIWERRGRGQKQEELPFDPT